MNLSPNYAGIDIGSNAIRLLIANAVEENDYINITKKLFVRIPIRLGEDAFGSGGAIGQQKITNLVNALTGFRYLMKTYNVIDYKAYATSAMREASNGKEVASLINQEAGIDVRIIDGQTEAEVIYTAGAATDFNKKTNVMYVDVGGGSTEVTIFRDNKKTDSRSFKLGTVRMLQQKPDEQEIAELKNWVKSIANTYKPKAIIGTGGNINKIQKMINKRSKEPILFNEMRKLHEKIKDLSIEDRIIKLSLSESRADVIVPALQIFLAVMKITEIDEVYVPKVGLADGIVRELYYLAHR
ncbi:MAG: ethanolamine ammonia-lyase reactivating factor EutA [Candidatus Azobacteroides sp.]|nr:ethanolamine ammonia-lyase reactivating factor EutA [Candidatus Azobacteroides sp.]